MLKPSGHNANQRIHANFQDAIEDNASKYRQALTTAQRAYRDAMADTYR